MPCRNDPMQPLLRSSNGNILATLNVAMVDSADLVTVFLNTRQIF